MYANTYEEYNDEVISAHGVFRDAENEEHDAEAEIEYSNNGILAGTCLPKPYESYRFMNHLLLTYPYILLDSDGTTLAHEAAIRGELPEEGFKGWDITDKNGRAVAHVAAIHGHLPDDVNDFDQWHLEDGTTRKTVAEYAIESGESSDIVREAAQKWIDDNNCPSPA
jgi:hypothetical protein